MELKNMKDILKLNFKARHAGMAAITNIAVLLVLIVLNLIVQEIPASWDMTRRKLFSLTEQTTTLVKNINQEAFIYLLAKPGNESKEVLEVLEKYDHASKAVSLEIIDPDRNPTLISRYTEDGQEVSAGSVIVASGNYSRVIDRMDLYSISQNQQGNPQIVGMTVEQRVTSALSYVISGREPGIYELEGHNEYRLADLNLTSAVNKVNYRTESLNLMKVGKVPSDADVLVVIAPERDLSDFEAKALQEYMTGGGSLFLAMGLSDQPFPNFNKLLSSYNLRLLKGVVMETNTNRLLPGMGNNPFFFAPYYPEENPVTDPLKENSLDVFLFSVMGIEQTDVQKRNMKMTPLLITSNSSWLRTDMQQSSESRVGSDIPGPLNTAVSVAETNRDTGKEDGARLILLATGDFLSPVPGMGQVKANVELFLNGLNWLSDQEDVINISSKSMFRLPLRINALQAWIYAAISILLIPLLIIICGTFVSFRRKNL